jgi:hypothetical protein
MIFLNDFVKRLLWKHFFDGMPDSALMRNKKNRKGATTFSKMTLSKMTLSLMTFSIMDLILTLSTIKHKQLVSVRLSVSQFVHRFVCLSTCPPVHLSTCPPVHLSICPIVYLSCLSFFCLSSVIKPNVNTVNVVMLRVKRVRVGRMSLGRVSRHHIMKRGERRGERNTHSLDTFLRWKDGCGWSTVWLGEFWFTCEYKITLYHSFKNSTELHTQRHLYIVCV